MELYFFYQYSKIQYVFLIHMLVNVEYLLPKEVHFLNQTLYSVI